MTNRKSLYLLLLLFMMAGNACAALQNDDNLYGVGQWNSDTLGNHRVVLRVQKSCDAVLAKMMWRRRDLAPEKHNIIITDAQGNVLKDVMPINISREYGEVAFRPTLGEGTYYLYYMPYKCNNSSYPTTIYPPFVDHSDKAWVTQNKLTSKSTPKLPEAIVEKYEAINTLNSFYPMELIATKQEVNTITTRHQNESYLVFPEDRLYPIRMTKDIPWRWIQRDEQSSFTGNADLGEYYTFQLGLYAATKDITNIKVLFSDFINTKTNDKIMASSCTCFNTGGVDVTGQAFTKDCNVSKGLVQALWLGIQVPERIKPGTYIGTVTLETTSSAERNIEVTLNVSDRVIANHGDNETWRHSRLRWLNSQIGTDDEVLSPYTALQLEGKTIHCLGRDITLSDLGLPSSIKSYFTEAMTEIGTHGKELLSAPITFSTNQGEWHNLSFEFTKKKSGTIAWKALNENDALLMQLEGQIEFDGNIEYKTDIISKADISSSQISLMTILPDSVVAYKTGLGESGGNFKPVQWKWNVENNQDAVWVGDVNGGLQIRLYDDKYVRPLNTNFYHQQPLIMPDAWYNNGKGGINISSENKTIQLSAYSGLRDLKKGDCLKYYFNVLVTPFHPIDLQKQWADRYYHAYVPIDTAIAAGATIINVHHGTPINPFINYPFLRPTEMKSYIDQAHSKGLKVKIYDTVRELSNSCTELFALRSLNNEIFSKGKGGGFAWLQEHLDSDYIGAWFVPQYKDAAIINTAVSRWHNYYLEGLNWLVNQIGIDGLYIDDLAFDRTTMKRVRKILQNANPGTRIDLHSANQFNPRDGYANSANLYMEHLPYIDRLWFGEYFKYDSAPDYWLMECSGIPFGLMGEMLQDGGNPWRGMIYGMTNRLPWSGDPRPIWKFIDAYGIKQSKMIGYWVKSNPVRTSNDAVLATVYTQLGKAIISLASWAKEDTEVKLHINWKQLGINPKKAVFRAPYIKGFQDEMQWKSSDAISIKKDKGFLIVIE